MGHHAKIVKELCKQPIKIKNRSYDISSIYVNIMEKIILILEIRAEFIIA
jgi:hypothetical protein